VFISRVGMYGRIEDQVGANPIGTLPPERVGEAAIRAIRDNPAELILSGPAVRPLVWLYALFPGTAAKLARNRRSLDFAERLARAGGRL